MPKTKEFVFDSVEEITNIGAQDPGIFQLTPYAPPSAEVYQRGDGKWVVVVSEEIAEKIGRLDPSRPPPLPFHPVLSRTRVLNQFALDNVISKEEALNCVAIGNIPEALKTAIETSVENENDRFTRLMKLSGDSEFESNGLVMISIMDGLGWDERKRNEFLNSASSI